MGGGGFIPLNTVAGAGYVSHFLKFFRSPQEDAGKLIRITLAWTQYQSGMPFPILTQPWTPIHYVSGRFYRFLMTYLDDINGSIQYTPSYTQPKLRANDRAIMEVALELGIFTVTQLQRINCVRMYLGFTYISEICNTTGSCIHSSILSWTKDAGPYHTTLSRPTQPRPNNHSWVLWERVLQSITTKDGKTLIT